jgi:hypothetical protein
MPLILRSANSSRGGGDWNSDDFDVFDGGRLVGRVYRVNSPDGIWFWAVSFPAHQPKELRARVLVQ